MIEWTIGRCDVFPRIRRRCVRGLWKYLKENITTKSNIFIFCLGKAPKRRKENFGGQKQKANYWATRNELSSYLPHSPHPYLYASCGVKHLWWLQDRRILVAWPHVPCHSPDSYRTTPCSSPPSRPCSRQWCDACLGLTSGIFCSRGPWL